MDGDSALEKKFAVEKTSKYSRTVITILRPLIGEE